MTDLVDTVHELSNNFKELYMNKKEKSDND